jgi:hypothetical protein
MPKCIYTLRVVNPPATFKQGYFPRKYIYKQEAIDMAKRVVEAGASMARIEISSSGAEMDFYPPKKETK